MKQIILYVLLILAAFGNVQAQDAKGTIKGKVSDGKGELLTGISLGLKGTSLGAPSDVNGEYVITNIPAGDYQLIISGIGFESQSQDIQIEGNQVLTLDFTLKEYAEELQTVEVIGRMETEYANNTSFVASKTATLLKDVPQSVGYVTKELALDQAAFRVNDVVKNISGVNQFSFYNDITIRGYRVKGQGNSDNLVNGMRAFTSFWKQQLIPHIERVEVIKGPASALFGNASPGGTINRVTKKPLAEQRQSISATVGSFNTFRTLADFTGPMSKDEKLLYRLNLGYENSGNFRDLQFDKNLIIAPSFSFLPSDKTRLNFDIVFQNSNGRLDRGQAVFGNGDLYSVPTSKALNAANDYLKEENLSATLSLNHQFTKKIAFNSIYMRSGYSEDLLEHRTANTFATLGDGSKDPEKVEMRVSIRKRNWNNDNFNNYFNFNLQTGKLEHKLLVGYDYFQQVLGAGGSQLQARGYLTADRTATINSFNPENAAAYALDHNGNPIPNVPHFDLTDPTANQLRDMSNYIYQTNLYPQSKLSSHGIYVQDQVTIGKLKMLFSLRKDYYFDDLKYKTAEETSVEQSALIPRIGAVYEISRNINVYGTYVEGYQPQSASVVNDPNAGGPFDPLTSDLIEFGAKTNWLEGRLNLTLAAYQLRQKGALYAANDLENPDLLIQIGEELAKGFEFDVVGKIRDNWSIVANYSYNDAVITQSDDELEINRQKPNAPKHAGNIWTKYVINQGTFNGIGFGLGANFVTERYGSIVQTDEPPVFPGYELLNAAIYYKVDKFQIQVNVNNVLNETHWVGGYDYIRAFPGAPRNLMTTVSYTF
ncbi:MAG: TonB-dependent receptor [Flammeovirgaceae bacterium]|nr:TonB-dependent receptor [Flammeovirgaceae bacterium]